MLEKLIEKQNRTVRGNKYLILLRLLVATVALALLILQESMAGRSAKGKGRPPTANGEVTALTFTSGGARLISGGSDATIRVWDLETGGEVTGAIEGHGDIVRQLAQCAALLHPDFAWA